MSDQYKTSPAATEGMPKGIPYIIGNEAAERFSFYGMKAILVVFMTKYLIDSSGYKDVMSGADAKVWYHTFTSAVYFTPIFGALLCDYFLGKYRTILSLSVVYCLGHLALALDETRTGLTIGLTLIAIGSGGIKPCVSAHVGDQFGKSNAHLIEKVFGWFYFSINLGAFASTLMTPLLLKHYGPSVAFGVPGALMLAATWMFWLGRKEFIHIPAGGKEFVKEVLSGTGLKSMGGLFVIYVFVAMFWALFDQTGSAWVLQAEKMNRSFLGITWESAQIQAINPIMIMVFIPIFSFVIYPFLNKIFPLTPLRKISIGFFVTVPAFLIPAWIEGQLGQGIQVNIVWQLLAYAILTAAEVFVSITCLEFSYTQAPKKMKSFVMAFFLMSVSLGNTFVAVVNYVIQDKTPLAKIETTGSMKLTPKKTTVYQIACKDDKDTLSQKIRVAVEVPIKAAKKKKAEKNKAAKTEDDRPQIVSWAANGSQGNLTVRPGTLVTLTWKTKGVLSCKVGKDIVPTNGSRVVKAEKSSEYALVCLTQSSKVGAKLKLKVHDGVTLDNFTINGKKGGLSFPPPGKEIELKWASTKAKSCQLVAHTIRLEGPSYYYFFAGVMLVTAILFIFVALMYKGQTYIQDEEDAEPNA